MKKYLIIVLIFFAANLSVQAGPYTPTLGKIENVLYGFQYDNEDDSSRLARIEESVYGMSSAGDVGKRMAKLKNDLSADLIGHEIEPKEDTFREDDWVEEIPKADANIQYPAVDELEMRVFNNKFPQKDIKERLSALEEKTFGQTFNDDLASRTDRLKAELKPSSFMDNAIAQSSNDFYDDEDVITLDKSYHLDRYESPNMFDYDAYNAAHPKNSGFFKPKKANITTVENAVLNQSFKDESMEKRLSRLEYAMFGTNFAQDDTQTRAERIASAYHAQKSSAKYDSNKFTQNMATAMQIGTLILMVLACIL